MTIRRSARGPGRADRGRLCDGHYDLPPSPHALFGEVGGEVARALAGLTEADRVVGARPGATRTPGQTRRLKRDAVIYAAARLGFPRRWLADVFGLPRSRVGEIVADFGARWVARGPASE